MAQTEVVALPEHRYDIIYADPPWAWGKSPLVNRGAARTVEKEYPTMQPDEIKAMPIARIAKPESALFLWATSPKLPLAFEVMAAWGFTFKSVAFVWVKTNRKSTDTLFTGMGFYTRQNAEFVLLGTRGPRSPERLDRSVHQIVEVEPIYAPVSAHSVKPEEVRSRIDRLFGGTKIELFARRRRDGWDAWGNEIDSTVDVAEVERVESSILGAVAKQDSLFGGAA